MTIRYYTRQAVDALHEAVESNLDWYYEPSGLPSVRTPHAVREFATNAPSLAGRLTAGETRKPSTTDAESALTVYEALRGLSPHQASEERLWTYLCHVECPKYVSWRWLGRRPPDTEEAVKKVRNHFFAPGNRALIRDNGISRLWWLGYIAHQIDREQPRRFLEILLHRQDVRSALIERPAVSMNRQVLRGIYRVMKAHWQTDKSLFERGTFRSWMVALNRRGGVLLLDAVPEQTLDRLVRREAAQALMVAAHKPKPK